MKRIIIPALLAAGLGACSSGGGNSVDVVPVDDNLVLDFQLFEGTAANNYQDGVNAIFDRELQGRRCSDNGCHNVNGGAGGALKVFPSAQPGSTEMMANFFSASALANISNPANSKLLLEPLAGTSSLTGSHTGGDIFSNESDSNYQTILVWISNPSTQ